ELADGAARDEDDEGREQQLPVLEQGEDADVRRVESLEKETKPPRRYTDASLLGAMETAGKLVDDDELREAMKDSGIGTPATRAAIIERLIDVAYIERDGRALIATDKGIQVIRLLGSHPLTSPELTGDWERRLGLIEQGDGSRPAFMSDIAKFTTETVQELDKLKDVKIERANLGPCPVCGRDVIENRKGYSCWSKDDPGCGFVIWKKKAGKILPVSVVKELMATGKTAKPVTGFRGRSGRTLRAEERRLAPPAPRVHQRPPTRELPLRRSVVRQRPRAVRVAEHHVGGVDAQVGDHRRDPPQGGPPERRTGEIGGERPDAHPVER